MLDPYLYPETGVLINKFNEQCENQLEMLEAHFVASRLRDIITEPIDGDFGVEHLCATHQYIFQDLFDWAGQTRTIQIEKNEPVLGGLSIEYSKPENIFRDTSAVLSEMKSTSWELLAVEQKAALFAKQLAALWKVHPFREGNTRTIITFCCQFAECQGFPLNHDFFKDYSLFVRTALVAASASFKGVGDRSQPQYIAQLISDAIRRETS